jgi:type I pantothenate kinase
VSATPTEPPTAPSTTPQSETPFIAYDRQTWAGLAASTPLPLTAADVERIRGIGEMIDLEEVDTIHRPLSRLLHLHAGASRRLYAARQEFLRDGAARVPYVIGIGGSVAVGKSTTARLLVELLARWPGTPRVALVPTDGFLLPNAVLERRGLMNRKGFPESYDRHALIRFLTQVKSGLSDVAAPVYSHLTYDIVPDRRTVVRDPDILIVEGLNVLQPPRVGQDSLAVSDLFDFSIYIDAATADIRQWYLDRFLELRQTSFARPESYFHRYASLSDAEASAMAAQIWSAINEPNLVRNILPTRARATLVLRKAADHRVSQVLLRRI